MSKVTETVTALAAPVAEKLGLELWDVEYIREAGQWFLRVYIDKDGGVSINDCEALSPRARSRAGRGRPHSGQLRFEVSSAGAERELKRPGDFRAFMGSGAEVRLYKPVNGSKSFVGTLSGYRDGDVTLTIAGKETTFEKAQIAQVRLRVL